MASSQVGFAASCIFRDLNQRESNNQRTFLKKNGKDFVKQRVGNFVLDENCHENISSIVPKSGAELKSSKIDNVKNEKFDETKKLNRFVSSVEQKSVVAGQLVSPKASSLVQIWEERLRQSSSLNDKGPSRGNSGCSSLDNVEETPRESFSGESDLTSERSFRSRNSDAEENERVRVADIVKRLTNVDGENEFGLVDQVVCSPRIRGRQAFNELLMKMERDRYNELDELADSHAVSRFKHRKRIQSSLRLRILQRQMATDGREGTKKMNSPGVKGTSLGSNIMQLREKFSMGFGRCMTFPGKEVEFRRPKIEIQRCKQHKRQPLSSSHFIEDRHHPEVVEQQTITSAQHKRQPSSSSQLNEDKHHPEVVEQKTMTSVLQVSVSQSAEDSHKEANQSPDVMQATCKKACSFGSQDSINSLDSPQPGPKVSADFCSQPNENRHFQEVHTSVHDNISPLQHHSLSSANKNIYGEANVNSNIAQGRTPEACNIVLQGPKEYIAAFPRQEQSWRFGNMYPEGTADEMMFPDNWEEDEVSEEEYYDEQLMEINYDWVNDIARPRSYWEDCRQSRYQEVLNKESNNEIRQLLERGTVSSFLSSALRDRIEGLMESRIYGTHPAAIQEENDKVGIEQFMLSLNRGTHTVTNIDESRDKEQKVDSDRNPAAMQNHLVDGERVLEMEKPRNRQKHEDREGVIRVAELSHTPMSNNDEVIENKYLDQDLVAHDYCDHSTSSSQVLVQSQLDSWNHQNSKVRNSLDQITSTTSNPLLQSESYDQETHHSIFMCHSSIDAEVINDMRGKMEEIQREMLELRKSVKYCMALQFEMQQLFKQGVPSVTRDAKNPQNKRPRKHCCLICCKKQVDSLLYRCGHMCTCLDCAHELQYSIGKCPMCQSPIDDVVWAYTDSECC